MRSIQAYVMCNLSASRAWNSAEGNSLVLFICYALALHPLIHTYDNTNVMCAASQALYTAVSGIG